MTRAGGIIIAGLVAALAGCTGLPETAQGVTRAVVYEGNEYMVHFSVSEVTETLPAPATGTVRFDASFINITPPAGLAIADRSQARAVATAFCQQNGVALAPAPGVVTSYDDGRWQVQNHCASYFG